jgi:hypothetical protein
MTLLFYADGGVTFVVANGEYEVRFENSLRPSPTGEIPWINGTVQLFDY